jgi:RHS repeat-associated protein
VRDASGNVMSVYEGANASSLKQTEVHLYGSSRLGIAGGAPQITELLTLAGDFTAAKVVEVKRGEKFFEWSNHLGNVLATVSDRKIAHSSNSSTIDYYTADVISAQDYYPFGMIMPGRTVVNGNVYRYGFGGHEKDDEVKGLGNHISFNDYGYDPRIGRRFGVDPMSGKYPFQSNYSSFDNNPINIVDPTGKSGEPVIDRKNRTVTIYSHFVFYASPGILENAISTSSKIASNIEKQYNRANGKVKIDGKTYKVKFKITAEFKDDVSSNIRREITENRDIRNNYFRIGLVTDGLNSDPNTSYSDGVGSNTGYIVLDQLLNETLSIEHEYGHSIGLDHEVNSNGSFKKIQGQPGIMATQVNEVNPEYQEKVVRKGYTTPLLDRRKRKVTQWDIDNLNIDKIDFDKNSKAKIGKLTNEYHQ